MNPIFRKRINIYLYILAWLFISAIQASILVFYFRLDVNLAVTDSLVFNILFFLFGLLIWYPVRYIPLSNRKIYSVFLNHTALGILVISIWISTGFFILKLLFANNEPVIQSIILSVPYRIISGALLYVLLLMVYYLIIYSENLRERIRNEANLNALVREAELNMLKAQINPHFLFNSLNSLSFLVTQDPAGAREMIVRLSEFIRYSLKHKEKDRNPLREELENIIRYLDIEKVRFGDKLSFSIKNDEGLENWPLPNMILQPLFENAVKYGVYESAEPVAVEMEYYVKDLLLHIRIRNNYDTEGHGRWGAGIGLKNIGERLKLMYNRDDLISYKKADGFFTVDLRIPFSKGDQII